MSRLSVLTVTRKRRRASSPIGCAPIAHEAGEAPEDGSTLGVDRDVVHDAHAVAEPLRAAELDRLPDGRQPEGLTGVDRDVEVLAGHVPERVEVPGGRFPRLAPGDVEPDDPGVAVPHRELGDLA